MNPTEDHKTDLSTTSGDSSSKVTIEGESWGAIKYYNDTDTPRVIEWAMKASGGRIKDAKQAGYAILAFVAFAIIVSLILIFSSGSSEPTSGRVPIDQVVPR